MSAGVWTTWAKWRLRDAECCSNMGLKFPTWYQPDSGHKGTYCMTCMSPMCMNPSRSRAGWPLKVTPPLKYHQYYRRADWSVWEWTYLKRQNGNDTLHHTPPEKKKELYLIYNQENKQCPRKARQLKHVTSIVSEQEAVGSEICLFKEHGKEMVSKGADELQMEAGNGLMSESSQCQPDPWCYYALRRRRWRLNWGTSSSLQNPKRG